MTHLHPLRALMHGAIEYAGLFPPAALTLREAAINYAAQRAEAGSWMLGRLIIPAERLAELTALRDRAGQDIWPISAILGANVEQSLGLVHDFNERHSEWAQVETIEVSASSKEAIDAIAQLLPPGLTAYIEVATDPAPDELIAAVASAGLRAKVRCGGVIASAFPRPQALAGFLALCVKRRLPFKATAGLHHPWRGEYALTYTTMSAQATMYGFLNVMLATAALRAGADVERANELLCERDPHALQIADNGLCWRDLHFSISDLAWLRQESFVSFGSCSFHEPSGELAALYGALR
jgi:hypothetical protein